MLYGNGHDLFLSDLDGKLDIEKIVQLMNEKTTPANDQGIITGGGEPILP